MNSVIILRHVSGSGSSTFAAYLQELYPQAVICCADDYFMAEGVYKFVASDLGKAHGACYRKFKEALDKREKAIIVANTNTVRKSWKDYEKEAKSAGYTVFFCVLENRHGGVDSHQVPLATLEKQEFNIKNSLKLR